MQAALPLGPTFCSELWGFVGSGTIVFAVSETSWKPRALTTPGYIHTLLALRSTWWSRLFGDSAIGWRETVAFSCDGVGEKIKPRSWRTSGYMDSCFSFTISLDLNSRSEASRL